MSRRAVPPPSVSDPFAVAAERFHHDLNRALGAEPRGPILLAVSGGPDSMAMLTLAAATFPGRIQVATVDHRLRPAAADEAMMVANHCALLHVPHATLLPAEPITGASIQAAARQVRYQLLADQARRIGAEAIARDTERPSEA